MRVVATTLHRVVDHGPRRTIHASILHVLVHRSWISHVLVHRSWISHVLVHRSWVSHVLVVHRWRVAAATA